jgi:peptide chain release factor 2
VVGCSRSGGIFDFDHKRERLEEVGRELELPNVWDDPRRAQELGRERAQLERTVAELVALQSGVDDAAELFAMAASEGDEGTAATVTADIDALTRRLDALEFQRMFSGPMDSHNAFIDIQAGAGGTEAQPGCR